MSHRIPEKRIEFPLCPDKPKVPSDEEMEALAALKSIKERVRAVRKRVASLDAGPATPEPVLREDLERELTLLKGEWEGWEKRRRAAARERMIRLGHEDAGPKA
jgi:hypothetical protein